MFDAIRSGGKIMKRLVFGLVVLALVFALAVALVACGNGTNTHGNEDSALQGATNPPSSQPPTADDDTASDVDPESPDDDTIPESPSDDDGAWWTYSENYHGQAKSFLRFYSDTEWEMELLKDCIFAQATTGSLKWATGDYYFGEVEGAAFGSLYMRLAPTFWDDTTQSEAERNSVALLDKNGKPAANGTWVEYTADEDGYYAIRIAFALSASSSEDIKYLEWKFKPSSTTRPAYFFEDEQEYLAQLNTTTVTE